MYVDRNRLATDSHTFVIFHWFNTVNHLIIIVLSLKFSTFCYCWLSSSLHPLFGNFPSSGDAYLHANPPAGPDTASPALHIVSISISLPHPLHFPPPQSTLPPLSHCLPCCLPPSLSDAPVSPVSYFPDQRKLSRPVAVVGVKGLKVCICVCESIFITAHF